MPPATKTEPQREILLLDDDALALQAVAMALGEDYRVHAFTEPGPASLWLKQHSPCAAIIDLNLGNGSGLDCLTAWRREFPDLEVIVCSGEARVERAIECMRQGASDYVVKPFQAEDLRFIVRRVVEKHELKRRVEALDPLIRPAPVSFVGASPRVIELRHKLELLKGQAHLNVLLLGESGTGKEVVARQLHQQEGDPTRPFVVANMPAIPASLMEAELFGVEKGAYTDAKVSRAGKFEMADGGDIFLDEIGELALDTQAKLLRTLQERQVERVGSQRPRKISFRVISATNQPLSQLIADGRFREDLMYRLSDMVLWLPPLRERREDIPKLAEHFVRKYGTPGRQPVLSDGLLETLCRYDWPGNVRELESAIKRALAFNRGPVLDHVELFDVARLSPQGSLPRMEMRPLVTTGAPTLAGRRAQNERALILDALHRHRGNKRAVLAELGISRATLYRRLQS